MNMNKKLILLAIPAFALLFGSCKPKQSNYKSIYEAAKETEKDNADDDYAIPKITTQDYSKYDDYNVHDDYSDNMNATVKKEFIRPIYDDEESQIKRYSVVIAAMGMKSNAIALQEKMKNNGFYPIIVQNNQGLYRVIIAGSETRSGAVNERNAILSEFRRQGSDEFLRKKYGIPFNDWWILERDR